MGLIAAELFLLSFVFFTGSCIFSFLNVIIYRVPKKISFIKGYSVCPGCGHRLGPLDLIPVFSYLFLKGKCRYCGERIGIRDMLIEMLGGILAVICVMHFQNYEKAVTVFLFFCILTVVSFLDIDTMEIENECHLAILVLTLISLVTMPENLIISRLIGGICVSVPMLLLAVLVSGGFGGGDIKLMAASGVFLGWKLILISICIAILTGGLYGLYLLLSGKKGKKETFAFGPFLCLGMVISILWGQQILDWYLGFLIV